MADTYTCAVCQETFEKTLGDKEAEAQALAELQRNFPGAAVEDCAVICDDCYHKPGALDRALDEYQSRN